MYNFRIIEENTYYFITNNKTEYNIRFKHSLMYLVKRQSFLLMFLN